MAVPLNQHTSYLLRSVPFFRQLDEAMLGQLAAEVVSRQYQAGEVIFLEGEPFAGLHIVTKGLAKLYSLSDRGREYVLLVLQSGDSCNEVPIIDNGPNPVNLAAMEETTVWVVSGVALAELRRRDPQLNDVIIKNIAMRCRQLVKQVCRLSFLSVTGRLATFILTHSQGREVLENRWTQEELAGYLGTVREVVSRALRELQRSRLIERQQNMIYILDRDGLEEIAGF